jgi:hypothetical protein
MSSRSGEGSSLSVPASGSSPTIRPVAVLITTMRLPIRSATHRYRPCLVSIVPCESASWPPSRLTTSVGAGVFGALGVVENAPSRKE